VGGGGGKGRRTGENTPNSGKTNPKDAEKESAGSQAISNKGKRESEATKEEACGGGKDLVDIKEVGREGRKELE